MERKIRLDQILVQRGLAESREKAKAIVMAGLVAVDGKTEDKPGRAFSSSALVTIKRPDFPYVSRGGVKLEAALKRFSIPVEGATLLDVGASTGGFTDCLLQHGAERIVAVDVGYGQLDWRLRQDKRVKVLERTNIRYLEPEAVDIALNGAVIDVSFISLELVIPPVSRLLLPHSFIAALIKPQFEVGKGRVGKGGVVRDTALHDEVIQRIAAFCTTQGWTVRGTIASPLLGPKGNKEFLIYLTR